MAIETTAITQAIYGLPCRQTHGFLESIFELMKLILKMPYHRTLSRQDCH
ncbi:MAG: transposase [Acidobacteria bacterium]|nr:transposase [Acidobacteriota bacterium]